MKNRQGSLYLQELTYMREKMKLTAAERPHLTDLLNHSGDPDIERLLEGFALLTSGVRNKTEDNFPEVSQETLRRIWPHTLHPIPPSTIIQFTPRHGQHQGALDIPLGTPVSTAIDQQVMTFRTHRDLHIEPIIVLDKRIEKTQAHSNIILTLRKTGSAPAVWDGGKLSFFMGTDPARAAQLSFWLDWHIQNICLRTQEKEQKLKSSDFTGWAANLNQVLLPTKNNEFAFLQQITEYYCLPHVFDFIEFDTGNDRDLVLNSDGTFELIFRLDGGLPLDDLGDAFQLGCVPAIHLEMMTSPPITLEADKARYPLPLPEGVTLFHLHDIQTAKQPGNPASQRKTGAEAEKPRGNTHQFEFIEQFDTRWGSDCIYIQPLVSADLLGRIQNTLRFIGTNGKDAYDLSPQSVSAHFYGYHSKAMALGVGEVALTQESVPAHLRAHNITPVSPDYPPMIIGRDDWSLINIMNMPPFMLFHTEGLKALLHLFNCYTEHDRALSRRMQRAVDSILHLDAKWDGRLRRGSAGVIYGHYLHLRLDPDCFANPGFMYQFCRLISQLMACFISQNTFVMLKTYCRNETEPLWEFPHLEGLRSPM
ncbi:putative type VI secretion system protein [Xenorhabdus beddingii]|uniref:Putative type VI secretion system protein n=1 Tax=Xenorhabdus beddingii TaxID=40578 RepID=A0A1Y2SSE5_9GAMM|nr:type VI secretion system baseplate subunit TssF [Xenorhabdus beddingii]OTA21229.1 putative type VI secretion system protein [Xenorhabdus beddingii]